MQNTTSIWARRAVLMAAAACAGPALADDGPRYTYGEIGYSRLDIDNYSGDGDFGYLGGSLAIDDKFHLFASGTDGSIDASPSDVDVTTIQAGGGLNLPLNNTVDLVVDLAYVWTEVDSNFFSSQDDDGYAISAGLRAMVTPQLELNGGGSYVDVSDDDTAVYVGAVYSFTDMFAVSTGASFGDNATSYSVGLRLYFDMK